MITKKTSKRVISLLKQNLELTKEVNNLKLCVEIYKREIKRIEEDYEKGNTQMNIDIQLLKTDVRFLLKFI